MLKNKATFETFNDGKCIIQRIDDDGDPAGIVECLRYQERTVGVRRYYEAMTAKMQVDMLIRVPYRPWLTNEYVVSIDDKVYGIVQVQRIHDTLPEVSDISLCLKKQREVIESGAVRGPWD